MAVDLDAAASLNWTSRDESRERRFRCLKDAVRVAMKELSRTEFFSCRIVTAEDVYAGDQIVEIFQTGRLGRRGYAIF